MIKNGMHTSKETNSNIDAKVIWLWMRSGDENLSRRAFDATPRYLRDTVSPLRCQRLWWEAETARAAFSSAGSCTAMGSRERYPFPV